MGCDDGGVLPVKFRHNAAIAIAGLIAFFSAVPFATSSRFLLPFLLVPLLVAVWGWRAGTDADQAGIVLRAVLGSRRVAWSEISQLGTDQRGGVHATLDRGGSVRLPAVCAVDLPWLVAASGQELTITPSPVGQERTAPAS